MALGSDNKDILLSSGHYAHSCSIKNDCTIRLWGYNGYGQLGNGSKNNITVPIEPAEITAHPSAVKKVVMGGSHTYNWTAVLFEDGVVMTCGYNGHGQLGQGDKVNKMRFAEVRCQRHDFVNICAVGIASEGGLGLLNADGQYFQTGNGDEGQVPFAENTDVTVPHLVAL